MFLPLDVLLQRMKIPRIFTLWRVGVDFCSGGPSYSFGIFFLFFLFLFCWSHL